MEANEDAVDAKAGPVGTVLTEEEYEEAKEVANNTSTVLVVQLGSEACTRCPAFHDAVAALTKQFVFRWVYCDAYDADSNLPEHFDIKQLPGLVVYDPQSKEHEVRANADAGTLHDLVAAVARPTLSLDADF